MKRVPRKIKKLIPKGVYCYRLIRYHKETGDSEIKVCPFYEHIEYTEGYCKLYKGEVDDQCKGCSIKMDIN